MPFASPRLPTRSVAALVLAALVVWAPMPFGAVRPPDRYGLQLWILVALLAVAASRDTRSLASVRWVLLPAAVWTAWCLAQALPLPLTALDVISPTIAEAHRRSARLAGAEITAATLSAAPSQTLRAGLWGACLLAAFTAASLCGARSRYRRLLAGALLGSAAFQVLYGFRHWGTAGSVIWGETVAGGSSRLRGTYVNPDHLALLLELALCVTAAVLWWAVRRARRDPSLEIGLVRVTLPTLLWIGLFAALAFTGSRAGILAGVVGTLAQGLAIALKRRRASLALGAVMLISLGVAVVSWIGFHQGWGRWLATSRYELEVNVRHAAYRATTELWLQAPVTGVGLGAFRASFPVVQPEEAPGRWRHAHNDWLEILATTGLVGLLLVVAATVALGLRLHRVWRHAGRSEARAAGLAGLGALVAIAVHESLDFGLAVPANALALAVALGVACGATTRSRQPRMGGRAASSSK